MEHRKFKKILDGIDSLTAAQTEKLITAQHHRGDHDDVRRLIEQAVQNDLNCPHCGERHVRHWRTAHGLQRYRCTGCDKTFNALTGTPLARLRHKERWLRYAKGLEQSLFVRKNAEICDIDGTTSFRWRHRFLKSQNVSKDRVLVGIVEIDETFFLESCKGKRKLTRKVRKRGGKAEKSGLSSESVPVLIARDRYGNMIDAVLPDRSEKAVSKVLKDVVLKDDVLLCMDGDKALIAFAEIHELKYELIIASKNEHVHEKVLHIQNVNAYMSRLKKWMKRFNGVAMDYLASYLGWRRMLEQGGVSINPESCLSAAIG